jgi:hypothetical protein
MPRLKLFEEWCSEQINLNPIDSVRWGNPTSEKKKIADTPSPIKDWFLQHPNLWMEIIESAPQNSSLTTKQELADLVVLMSKTTPEELLFAQRAEEDYLLLWGEFWQKHQIPVSRTVLENLEKQVEPLLFHLKDIINRPRPYQLAYYLGIELYPLIHTDASSASYPSGHSLNVHLIAEIMAQKHPQLASEIMSWGTKIAFSREQVGVHYPSDGAIAQKIARMIVAEKLIKIPA